MVLSNANHNTVLARIQQSLETLRIRTQKLFIRMDELIQLGQVKSITHILKESIKFFKEPVIK